MAGDEKDPAAPDGEDLERLLAEFDELPPEPEAEGEAPDFANMSAEEFRAAQIKFLGFSTV